MNYSKTAGSVDIKIEKIKQQLLALGDMRPGSLSKQYNVCGKKDCRCKHPTNPKRHGPYYQLSYVHQGKSTSRFIRPNLRQQVAKELATYKKFRSLTQLWIKLALKKADSLLKSAP